MNPPKVFISATFGASSPVKLQDEADVPRTIATTEEIPLDELREWQLTAKTTGH